MNADTVGIGCASAQEYTPSGASEDRVGIDVREDFTVAVAAELLKRISKSIRIDSALGRPRPGQA